MRQNSQYVSRGMNPPAQNLHGNARWMDDGDITAAGLADDNKGVLLGQTSHGQLIRFNRDGHIMVFAPTGAGKGIGFVQPNLVDYEGSMVVIDTKGENSIVSATYRRSMGQEVVILDPFNKTGMGTMQYGPMGGLLYADRENLGPIVEGLSDALVPVTGQERESHWPLGAKKFASFLMWYMIAHEPPERRNLIRLFELAHSGREHICKIADVMKQGLHPDDDIKRICVALGNWFLGREAKEFSYFESQVVNNLGWIGDFVWSKILGARLSEPLPLKRKRITVYLVLPFTRIERYRPWLRIMVADLINSLYDTPGALKIPVLFMLDEAYSGLGYMESLFSAAAAVRSAGARLCFIYQDIAQVQKLYGKAWSSLIANSGATLFWSVNDMEAAQFISQFAGTRTVQVLGQPSGMGQPLIRPEQVLQLPSDEIIGLFRNLPPARFWRLNVLTDPRFKSKLARNTTYDDAAESAPRSPAARDWVPVDLSKQSSEQGQRIDREATDASEQSAVEASADEMEIAMLAALSNLHKRYVFKHTNGHVGYLDDGGNFVPVDAA